MMENNKANQKDNQSSSSKGIKPVEKKERRYYWIYQVAIVLILWGGATAYFIINRNHEESENSLVKENTMLYNEIEVRDSLVDEWVYTLMNIEEDLMEIQEKESYLASNSENLDGADGLRDRIYQEIQNLNVILKENKDKLAALNRKLKNSGIKIASLEKKIDQLEYTIAQRDSSIHDLKVQLVDREVMLTALNTQVEELNTTILSVKERMETQDEKMNTAFIAKGSFDELEEKGVLVRDGGFLGLGGEKNLVANFEDKQFDEVKITDTEVIPIFAKKAHLVTDHPTESYEMVKNDTLIAYLQIKDKQQFWKITKYAVVETKQ